MEWLSTHPIWVDGRFGSALAFDGSCVNTNKKLLNGKKEFTVVAWIKPGTITENRIGLIGQNDSPEFGFIDPGTVSLWTPAAGINNNPYEHPPGEWHHVAAVASQEFTKVYIDGTPTTKKWEVVEPRQIRFQRKHRWMWCLGS